MGGMELLSPRNSRRVKGGGKPRRVYIITLGVSNLPMNLGMGSEPEVSVCLAKFCSDCEEVAGECPRTD